ncbi:MAG TPA: hypothetical protein VMG34_10395 [Bacteroidota bacterium]|nr:hypothetical protein [Bacteroidota bacterium]
MKSTILFSLAVLLVFASAADAQEKLSKQEWQDQITQYTSQRDHLKAELAMLTHQVDSLKTTLASLGKQVQSVRDETLALTGANAETIRQFEQRLGDLERRVAPLLVMSDQDLYVRRFEVDSLQAEKDALSKERIADAERYYERLQKVQNELDGLRATLAKAKSIAESTQRYVVRSWAKYKDCLWNISKQRKIYDSPFLWPKIWQANRDQIKDPDLIRIGEHLKIPPEGSLTTAEKRAEEHYWSKKHA